MGSLAGHVLPGVFFLIYGLAWVLIAMWTHLKLRTGSGLYNKKKREGSTASSASTSFFEFKRDQGLSRKSWLPLPCFPRFPLEPILKIVFPLLGIICEMFFDIEKSSTGGSHLVARAYRIWNEDGTFNDLGKLHHATMYSAFMLSGVVDILTIFLRFPRQTSPLFLSIAFWTEGVLFYFHTHGRDPVNVQIHFLLTVVIFSCVFLSLLRIFYATNFVINLGLGCSIVLQGTWFIHAGHLLYPPGGHSPASSVSESHANAHSEQEHADAETEEHSFGMYVSACFTWHIMSIATAMLILWVIFLCVVRSGVGRRLSKRGGLLNKSHKWVDVRAEERERLITGDALSAESRKVASSRGAAEIDGVPPSIEMLNMFEPGRSRDVLNKSGKVGSNSENEIAAVDFQNVSEANV